MRMVGMTAEAMPLRPKIGERLENVSDLDVWSLGRLATEVTRHRLGALESRDVKPAALIICCRLSRQQTAQEIGERPPKLGPRLTISLFVEEAITRNRRKPEGYARTREG
jgi:hypothetical protein